MVRPRSAAHRPKPATAPPTAPRVRPGETALDGLARWLRAQVLGGAWRPGQPLPPARVLARRRQVSTPTVQRAYRILVDEGLVEARLRRGYYPVQLPLRDRLRRGQAELEAGLAPALEDAVLTGLSRTQIRFTFAKLLEEVRGGGQGCRPPHPAAPARRRLAGRAR